MIPKESVRRAIPKFVTEGYALYRGGEFYIAKQEGKEVIVGRKTGLDFIGIRPDAPDWAQEEYKEWVTSQ